MYGIAVFQDTSRSGFHVVLQWKTTINKSGGGDLQNGLDPLNPFIHNRLLYGLKLPRKFLEELEIDPVITHLSFGDSIQHMVL